MFSLDNDNNDIDDNYHKQNNNARIVTITINILSICL